MKTLVYGLGISGKSAIKLLKELGHEIAIYDDNADSSVEEFVTDRRGLDIDGILEDVGMIVISPSVEAHNPILLEAKERGVHIISEIELAFRNCKGDVIAITGTNGKTTCVELMSSILNNACINALAVGNNGVGFAGSVSDIGASDVAVVEVSSFQLECVDLFAPKIAICLNIAEDHIERHINMDNYINAKKNIFHSQSKNDYAILNYDDCIVRDMASDIISNTYFYSTKCMVRGAYVCANSIYFKNISSEFICSIDSINMQGHHNLENALACITAGKILNIPNSVIIETLSKFSPPAHRVELIANINGVNYYNDSKATNISATLSAAKCMRGKTTLLLGGYDKGLSYKDLFDKIPLKIGTVIAFGANRERIIEDCKHLNSLTVIKAEDIDDAINIASKVIAKNVLFSPATSSYDRFGSYIERGEYFVNKVKGMIISEKEQDA